MPWLKHVLTIGFLVTIAPCILYAQDITNFSYKLVGDKIEVNYSLTGKASDRYKVTLFTSLDNYGSAIKLVTGDVGDDITPGNSKKIVWDAKKELGEAKGALTLKLKTQFIPFLTFTMNKGDKLKMGKANEITWQGDVKNLKLELFRNDKKLADIGTAANGEQYTWQLAKKSFEKGNYQIKGSANGREAFSEEFVLVNKMPVYVFLIPVAVIGGVLVAVLSGGTDSPEPVDNTIPEPVGPN